MVGFLCGRLVLSDRLSNSPTTQHTESLATGLIEYGIGRMCIRYISSTAIRRMHPIIDQSIRTDIYEAVGARVSDKVVEIRFPFKNTSQVIGKAFRNIMPTPQNRSCESLTV